METDFQLDSRLDADTRTVCDLPLSRVLLMNDRRYPWVILVPRRSGISEWIDLDERDGRLLWEESMQLCRILRDCYPGDKLNVGALGNLVPQLHLHHVVRRINDTAWPGPVWGHSPGEPYPDGLAEQEVERLRSALL